MDIGSHICPSELLCWLSDVPFRAFGLPLGVLGSLFECSWPLLQASLTPERAIIFDARNYPITGTKTRGHFGGLSAPSRALFCEVADLMS